MNKVKVQFVKYDMTKTQNRKRKDMLVDAQNESAVITQLERIHKGEKVVTIHELVWDEQQIKEVALKARIDESLKCFGMVKFFDSKKGFGFIKPEDEMDDLFFHATSCSVGLPMDGDRVEFLVHKSPKGLTAVQIKILDL